MLITSLELEDIKLLIKQSIKEVVKEISCNTSQSSRIEEKLLTRIEAANYLHISLPTLNVYTRKGLIKSTRLGKSVRYFLSDIVSAMTQNTIGGKNAK